MYLTDHTLLAVRSAFLENFEIANELGASLSVWQHGEEVLHLAHGFCERDHKRPWTKKTLIPVYSATKGPASATLLHLLDKNGLTPHDKVRKIWSRFPQPEATFADLLSHQCGLPALDAYVSVFDYDQVIEAVEKQIPAWSLGQGHGYHPRTFGFLVDEVCRLLTGQRIATIFQQEIAKPLDLEMWLGLPEKEHSRVATLYTGKMNKSDMQTPFYHDFNKEGTLVRKAFNSPRGLHSVQQMNQPQAWESGLPAMAGMATAQALSKFYQATLGEMPLFSNKVQQWIQEEVIQGDDFILKTPTRFSCGFQLDPVDAFGKKLRCNYGPFEAAFGHPGAGGSHAFADPVSGISFAYVMNQMELSVLPNEKSQRLIDALYSG